MTHSIVMAEPQAQLQREIADPRVSQRRVAESYEFASRTPGEVDWPLVDEWIVDRWDVAGLAWIKGQA
jgi:hypothetical protein